MRKEIIDKLDEITNIIDNDNEIIKYKKLKKELSKNKELINKIKIVKEMNDYNSSYIENKKDILNNSNYKEYLKIEFDLYLLIQEINKKLNSLKEVRDCHENN